MPLFSSDPDSVNVDETAAFMRNAAEIVMTHDERSFREGDEVASRCLLVLFAVFAFVD